MNSNILLSALGKAYPQIITDDFDDLNTAVVPPALAPFIAYYYCEFAHYSKSRSENRFVADIELGIYDFDKVFPLIDKLLMDMGELRTEDEFIFIGLINNGSSEEIYNNIRKYDTEKDWTYTKQERQLIKYDLFLLQG